VAGKIAKPQARHKVSPLRQRMIRDMELAGYTARHAANLYRRGLEVAGSRPCSARQALGEAGSAVHSPPARSKEGGQGAVSCGFMA